MTGTTGFVGSYVLKELLSHDQDIIVLKRSFSDLQRIEGCRGYRSYDLDHLSLEDIASKEPDIKTIVHIATDYARNGNYLDLLRADLMLPLELAQVFSKSLESFINTTTYYTDFGLRYEYLKEYILTKRHLLDWFRLFSSDKKLRFINMKLFHIYGPMDSPEKFTARVVEQLCKNVPQMEFTEGKQKRDFIYVEDVASAYWSVINNLQRIEKNFLIIDVGTGREYSLRHFIRTAQKIARSSSQLCFGKVPYRAAEVMSSKANPDFLKAIGWRPMYSLTQGLEKYISFLKDQ